MEEWLQYVAHTTGLAIEAIAIVVVAIGAFEALIGTAKVMLLSRGTTAERQAVWLNFARWLTAGLTFQLAADIVQTTVAPSWDAVGKLAAIAAIRTFLTFFLDRDMKAMRLERRESAAEELQHAGRE